MIIFLHETLQCLSERYGKPLMLTICLISFHKNYHKNDLFYIFQLILDSISTPNLVQTYLIRKFFQMSHTDFLLKDMVSLGCWLFTRFPLITAAGNFHVSFLHFLSAFNLNFDPKICPNGPEVYSFCFNYVNIILNKR